MTIIDSNLKHRAHSFLEAVQVSLEANLPALEELRRKVREIASTAKAGTTRLPERIFLNQFLVRPISSLMQSLTELAEAEARQAFLCEGYANFRKFCSGPPGRGVPHPFTKIIGGDELEVFRKWKGSKPFTKADPDFAFRDPFPFKIVFECKYFEGGSPEKAARELVGYIYQAFFYRSLPYIPPSKAKPAWDYDFACLLACDVSPKGTLHGAWDELSDDVKREFWDGANVYVMIIRPH
jgi:hypothetical protein